jgi:hypothetical protein
MIDDEFRRELRELYRADDRARAEHDDYMRQRKARASPPVSQAESEVIMYRTVDNNAALAAPAAKDEASEEQFDFSDEQFDALAVVIAELHKEFDERVAGATRKLTYLIERMAYPGEAAERDVHELRSRLTHLEVKLREFGGDQVEIKGMLGDVLRRYAVGSQVIELPGNFVRHTSIDADGKVTLIRRRHDDAA